MIFHYIVWFLLLVLVSCGSRKTSTKIDQKQEVESLKETQQTELKEQSTVQIESDIKIKENAENTEWTITKVFYESGALQSEQIQQRKGVKTNEKTYQDKKTQTTDIQAKTKEQHQSLVKKVSRSKEKQTDRAENWLLYLIIIVVGVFLWQGITKPKKWI